MGRSGIVILDTSALKYLEDPDAKKRVRANMRAADLFIRPSVINLLEILKTENPSIRERLRDIMRDFCQGMPLLPWPHDLVKEIGTAVAENRNQVAITETGVEWLLDAPPEEVKQQVELAQEVMRSLEQEFTDLHDDARPELQSFLKEHDLKDHWHDGAAYLDEIWSRRPHIDDYVIGIWKQLGLPGEPPVATMLNNEVWKVFLEATGFAAYERAVQQQPPKRVQYADLLQFVYIGASTRRILVSDDNGFLRAAEAVLRERYPTVRVMAASDFVNC